MRHRSCYLGGDDPLLTAFMFIFNYYVLSVFSVYQHSLLQVIHKVMKDIIVYVDTLDTDPDQ